ncbi:MAG TPA: sulfur carrier protein ThiS [Verrucomicrobiae bacterium]|nr:sulfur carrier protein ThiS [Verrucomicrobiae bacterium]
MASERAAVRANGQRREIDLPCSVADFVQGCGWKTTQVVVEHNGAVVGRQELGRAMLKDGDQLEIIVPVAGG